MDNQVRIFRKNPIAWWDKNVMRYLRNTYGKDKKTFLLVRSVYLALCEIESDFTDKPVNFFTKTVGTYAGLSREAAGKYINLLVKKGLIKKTQMKDEKTKSFSAGTTVEILGLENAELKDNEPVSAYPDIGVSRHRGNRATDKKLSIGKNLSNNVNENFQIYDGKKNNPARPIGDILMQLGTKQASRTALPDQIIQRDYLAKELVEKLGDPGGLGCYRKIAARIPPEVIFEVLANVRDAAFSGKIRQSRGALFVEMIKKYAREKGINLGFKTKEGKASPSKNHENIAI